MNVQVSPEILQRLDALAAKLGVTAQFIWGVLMRQAKVEAIEDIVSGLFFAALAPVLFKYLIWAWKRGDKDHFDNPFWPITAVLAGFGVIMTTLLCVTQLYSAITPIVNPQYWALQQILSSVK